MSTIICRDAGTTIEVMKRKRQVRAIWSTDEVDGHLTAFCIDGIDFRRFDKNPVILLEHGKSVERGTLPVASAIDYGPDRIGGRHVLVGTAKFYDDAEKYFDMCACGQLRGWSIRAQPVEGGPPTAVELRNRPDWAEAETVFRRAKLFEVSLTSLPSNASTLTLAVERAAPTFEDMTGRYEARKFGGVWGVIDTLEGFPVGHHFGRDDAVEDAARRNAVDADVNRKRREASALNRAARARFGRA